MSSAAPPCRLVLAGEAHEVTSALDLRYDLYEKYDLAVRRGIGESELIGVCQGVKEETGFSHASPVPISAADEAAMRASEAAQQQAQNKTSFFPFMSSFMPSGQAPEKSRGVMAKGESAVADAVEARRVGWEQWLIRAYESVEVVEASEAFVDFVAAEETKNLSSEDATVARAARRRRLVAEAKATAEAKAREALKATLRQREGEVASEIGSLEVRAAQLSRGVAGLRTRRQALGDFVESRVSWRESRAERREASLAQRSRLREELASAEAASAAAAERACLARDRRDAEAASGAALREAAERACDEAAAAQRSAQEDAGVVEERAARCRGRLGQRAAEAEAATQEARRAADARRHLEQVELPRCEAERAAAATRRKDAEDALAALKRSAATRTGRLALELARRHDERDAVEQLARLLDLKDTADVDMRLNVPTTDSFVTDDDDDAQPEVTAQPHDPPPRDDKAPAANAFEHGAVHVLPAPPEAVGPDDAQGPCRRRLIDAYASASRAVELALDATRRTDAANTRDLESELEAARAAETALARVTAGALDRRDVLRESSRRANRSAASALAAKEAAQRDLDECVRLEQVARRALLEADAGLDAATKTARTVALETSTREKQLRHALDADAHVSARQLAAASSEADALALAEGRLLDDDDDDPKQESLANAVSPGPPDVLDLAKDELARVDKLIHTHELDKTKVRAEIAKLNAEWESESVAMRAKLHGAECQLRIFRDDAQAAMRMQRDLQDTVST